MLTSTRILAKFLLLPVIVTGSTLTGFPAAEANGEEAAAVPVFQREVRKCYPDRGRGDLVFAGDELWIPSLNGNRYSFVIPRAVG